MEIRRVQPRTGVVMIGQQKRRVIKGLPQTPPPPPPPPTEAELLKSLVPDFPLEEIPEFLFGRYANKRVMPVMVNCRYQITSPSGKAYSLACRIVPTGMWVPCSQVYVDLDSNRNGYKRLVHNESYNVWFPDWLAREKGIHPDNPTGIDRKAPESARGITSLADTNLEAEIEAAINGTPEPRLRTLGTGSDLPEGEQERMAAAAVRRMMQEQQESVRLAEERADQAAPPADPIAAARAAALQSAISRAGTTPRTSYRGYTSRRYRRRW